MTIKGKATTRPKPDADPELEIDDFELGAEPAKPEKRSQPRAPKESTSAVLQQIERNEDLSLKELIDTLGPGGKFRIKLARIDPEEVTHPTTGQRIKTSGHLKDYHELITEEDILKRHGGGRYQLQIQRMNKAGSFVYFKQKTVDVAGEPRVDDLPRQFVPPASAAPQGDSPSVVKEAFALVKDELAHARDLGRRPEAPRGIDPSMQLALDMMRTQMEAQARAAERQAAESARQISELQAKFAEASKPVADPFKDKFFGKLMDDDSARLQAVRAQHESELRAVKQSHADDLKRIEDRHERALDNQSRSYQREIDNLKATNLIQIDAAKGAYETNMRIAEAENRRLERDNAELRTEVKELRAKKEKGLLETLKEVEAVKDALGMDDAGEKSTADKILEALPGAVEFAKGMIPQKAAAPAIATGNITPRSDGKPKLVEANGQKFWASHDAAGNLQLVPVKKKKKQAAPVADGMPTIDQEKVDRLVDYVERAFQANQDPEIFAQSSRSMIPEEILSAIRDHGVDVVLSKMAKLPGTSPLATQAGKNWMRKVGTALVGE